MAYYAALVSTVQLLKEMSHSEHQHPKCIFQKEQLQSLYETFSRLQQILEDYSPNHKEATAFLERIRDAACGAQDLIEYHIPEAACLAREIIEYHIPNAAYRAKHDTNIPYAAYRAKRDTNIPYAAYRATHDTNIPYAAYQEKRIIVSQIRQRNCLEEIIHAVFGHFVSACHNSEHVNEEVVLPVRKVSQDLLKWIEELGHTVKKGYQELENLIEEVDSISRAKGYLDMVIKGYQHLVKWKEELDAIVGDQDRERVKGEVDPIVGRGYQLLERAKEYDIITFDIPYADYQEKRIIVSQIRQRNCLEEIIHVVFGHFVSACHNSDHVNEEMVFTARKLFQDLLKLTEELGHTVEKGCQGLRNLIAKVDFRCESGKGYLDVVELQAELDPIVIEGYQHLVKLKEALDAIVGDQDIARVQGEVDNIVGRGYQLLVRLTEGVDSIVGRGYQDWERVKEEVDSTAIKGYRELVTLEEELVAIGQKGYRREKRYQDKNLDSYLERVEIVRSIVGTGYQDLERVKEEVDSIVGKGPKHLLENVKEEVDSLVEDLMRIKEKSHTTHQDDLQVSAGASTQRPSDGTGMVGFEKHLITIEGQLCGKSSRLEVISIVGMGGIGKTTLARNIFDDKLIREHFVFRVWVTVSQSYNLRNILLSIVNSLNINKDKLHGVGEGVLIEHIYQHLFGRRSLIIMDDVWDTKVLDDVKRIFSTDPRESRIIITTRQSDVASVASASDFINQIPFLQYDQSWNLFSKKVFCPTELKGIGSLIVKNCRGLPLAIVVVAGLLSKVNKTQDDWEEIARGVISTAARNDEHFSKILSLSYNYLPHHLKPCFLYLGGFPEDHEISVSKLIKLWVAEGFLKPIASKSLEEVAEEYLEELVKRNLVLITKRKSNGKFRCCNIHDLLRELCSERAHREHFLLLQHKHIATRHVHRFFIHPDSSSNICMKEKDILHVRSILSFGNTPSHISSHPCNFKPLRVLDAPNTDFFSPAVVFELLHLRYLVLLLRKSNIPPSIVKLQNLQTLMFVPHGPNISLPYEIWKMPQLRHIMIEEVILPPIPCGVTIINGVPLLGMLQTLCTVVDFKFNCNTVEMIPNLKKLKLRLYSLYNNYWEYFGLNHLVHLRQLETLDINCFHFHSSRNKHAAISFPKSFAFPENLKKLSLKSCTLSWNDMTIVGSLPNLQVLKLRWNSFVGEEWEPTKEEFPKLKFLLMERLYDLKYWRAENTPFLFLEHLEIKECVALSEIPSEIGDIPRLQLIRVVDCNSRVRSSALDIQETQSEAGNDVQVRFH